MYEISSLFAIIWIMVAFSLLSMYVIQGVICILYRRRIRRFIAIKPNMSNLKINQLKWIMIDWLSRNRPLSENDRRLIDQLKEMK